MIWVKKYPNTVGADLSAQNVGGFIRILRRQGKAKCFYPANPFKPAISVLTSLLINITEGSA